MATLDLEWISVFDEIYKALSVSRASEKLGMTQGAASTALNRLRAYYGDPLFVRTARGVLPTPRADALHETLHEVRAMLEQARAGSVFDPARAKRSFRVCMTDLGEISLLPRLLNHLQFHAQGIDIEAEKITGDSPRRLEEGSVDLAVGYMPQLEAGFHQRILFEQDFACIASQSHPRIGKKLTRAAYCRERHATVITSGTGHAAIVDKALADQGVTFRTALRVPSFLGLAQIVGETELIATVPRYYALAMLSREPVRLFELPCEIPHYAVKQHWHARYHRDPGNVWLRQLIADLLPAAVTRPPVAMRERQK